MKDDPKKRRVDRRFISSQTHEMAYLRRALARRYPHRTPAEIARAIVAVKNEIGPSEGRAYFMAVIELMLR